MKKSVIPLFLLFVFLIGCEKDYDGVLNPSGSVNLILNVYPQDSLDFGLGDSILFLQAKVASVQLTSVSAHIIDPLGRMLFNILLLDNGNTANADSTAGDSIYSNSVTLSDEYFTGQFTIVYYLNNLRSAVQYFYFDNGKEQYPPIISNLIIKDSVAFSEEMVFTIAAFDSNGYEDIVLVYFELFRPDGSQVVNSQGISKFFLNDTGNPEFRDVKPGDSIFTSYLNFPPNQPTVPPGGWRMEFEAVDRTRRLSNTIIHLLEVH